MVAITARSALPEARRVVIKVGSALLVDEAKNTINTAWLAGMARLGAGRSGQARLAAATGPAKLAASCRCNAKRQ